MTHLNAQEAYDLTQSLQHFTEEHPTEKTVQTQQQKTSDLFKECFGPKNGIDLGADLAKLNSKTPHKPMDLSNFFNPFIKKD